VNKQLDDAITRVGTQLTPEQIAEIERRLSDDEPYATSEEVRDLYTRLTK
jgi:hypothetical protein